MKKALSVLSVIGLMGSAMAANNYVPGEVLVKLKPGALKGFMEQKSINIKSVIDTSFGHFVVVKTGQSKTFDSISKLNQDPNVAYAEPNHIYKAIGQKNVIKSILTNDPKFEDLWGLKNTGNNEPRSSSSGNSSPSGKAGADVDALRAWEITKGSKQVKIAVIDTGVDYNHPDLKANMWVNEAEAAGTAGVDDDGNGYVDDIYGYDFANNDGDPMDGNGHGTHCSGTIAAVHDNGVGIAGVMANATIVAVKFLSDAGSGTTADAIRAIDYATKVGVDIMSNSWGGGGFSQGLYDAIKNAKDKGIVFTAAAGNSATNNNSTPHYPSNYQIDNVISVAAHNYNDELASFSCYGSETVHVAAPGRNILSTTPNNDYAVYSGTSMATPHVTGVVGLYLSHHGRMDVKQLRDKLMSSSVYARAYGRKTIGGGRANAYNFLTGVVADRPARPNPDAWVTESGDFESAHPYEANSADERSFSFPGAKFVRAIVKKYDLENGYDYLTVKDENGEVAEKLAGQGENYTTEYVEGDTIVLEFTSDSSVQRWGFQVESFQVVY